MYTAMLNFLLDVNKLSWICKYDNVINTSATGEINFDKSVVATLDVPFKLMVKLY